MPDNKPWCKLWFAEITSDQLLELAPAERWCWACLRTYANMHGQSGHIEINPRNDFLAMAFGCSKDDVLPILKRLPGLHIEESEKCNGKLSLHWTDWNKSQGDNSLQRVREHRSRKSCNGVEESRVEKSRNRVEKSRNTPQPPQGAVSRFEKFWQAYPKKRSRGTAERAFEKLKVSDELLATMLSALSTQAKSHDWTKEGGQYIPLPTTWLNGKRWMDEGMNGTNQTAGRGISGAGQANPTAVGSEDRESRYEADKARQRAWLASRGKAAQGSVPNLPDESRNAGSDAGALPKVQSGASSQGD